MQTDRQQEEGGREGVSCGREVGAYGCVAVGRSVDMTWLRCSSHSHRQTEGPQAGREAMRGMWRKTMRIQTFESWGGIT